MKSCKSEGISKFTASDLLDPHTFLHKLNTSRVKIRPVLKKFIFIFQSRDREKLVFVKIIFMDIASLPAFTVSLKSRPRVSP